MNKTSLFLSFIFIASNISASLDRFIQENPNISITSDYKPNLIERQNFIKYCLGQNYVSEKTVQSLANLSENKSYIEIDNAVSTAIKNYNNAKINQKSKYRKIMDSINPLNNNSDIEKHLFQVFKSENNSVKEFFKDHTPEIVLTSVIVATISLLGLKYLNKKPNMGPDLDGSNNPNSNSPDLGENNNPNPNSNDIILESKSKKSGSFRGKSLNAIKSLKPVREDFSDYKSFMKAISRYNNALRKAPKNNRKK